MEKQSKAVSKKKGNEKSKQKKELRKQAQEAFQRDHQKVVQALADTDPLASLKVFSTYKRNGIDVTLKFFKSEDLSAELKKFVFDLLKSNMQSYYENCEGWKGGWNDKTKRGEIASDENRYIICFDNATNTPVAYLMYRLLHEDDVTMLYVWEIQLEPSVHRKGLGKHLMRVAELIARKYELLKVVLTVFKANDQAVNFYTKTMKYGVDETDPAVDPYDPEDVGYQILSKSWGITPPSNKPVSAKQEAAEVAQIHQLLDHVQKMDVQTKSN